MKVETVEVCDLLDEQPKIALQSRHYVRFSDGRRHIDIEVRDGRLTARGSGGIIVRPLSGNQISIEFDE